MSRNLILLCLALSIPGEIYAQATDDMWSRMGTQENIKLYLGLVPSASVQAYNANLDDLADGSLTGSKVGTGVPAANIAAGNLGTTVVASSVTSYLIGMSTSAVKTGTETITVNATLQNDDELVIQVGASQKWIVTGFINAISTSATPDIKFTLTAPAATLGQIGWWSNNSTLASALTGVILAFGTSSGLIPIGAAIANPIHFNTTLVTTNAGALQLQWAQNTSDGAQLSVKGGSYITGLRVQ